jgi:DNA-binding LacI/PurR family transcriptional regulator
MRSKILSGEIPTGTKLPSTAAIARQLGTDVKTVHRALSLLTKEGLITRKPKIGTIVREREETISPVGIYSAISHPMQIENMFLHHLIVDINRELEARGLKYVAWNDHRSPAEQLKPMEEIEMAIRAGAIKSLIAVNFQPGADFWLEKLHIPSAFMSGSKSTGVSTGSHTFLRIALESLQAKGCRSVGLITHIAQSKIDSDFIDICQSLELVTDESLIMHASPGDMVPGELVPRSFERFGYEKFQELWLGRSRPLDGVVVFPDHAARGVVTAILQHGIRVGVDFHLALHRNEGIDYFCPVPASFISTSIGDIAKSLIGQLESQILSIPYSTIELPYKLVEDDPNPGR